MPDTVVPEVARQAWRILTLETPSLDDDAFRKDLSICLLLAFPCVAQVIEDLLRMRPGCLGLVSGSWYFDPAVAVISPGLAYVAGIPLAGGAFRARLGASAEDTELATAASATRRQMVAGGHYTPTRWLLVWPRAPLLAQVRLPG